MADAATACTPNLRTGYSGAQSPAPPGTPEVERPPVDKEGARQQLGSPLAANVSLKRLCEGSKLRACWHVPMYSMQAGSSTFFPSQVHLPIFVPLPLEISAMQGALVRCELV